MTTGKGRLRLPPPDGAFVAIDFETADYGADSACAVGLVRVEDRQIVHREVVLIRPPRRYIHFSYIHGITCRWSRRRHRLLMPAATRAFA